VPLLAKGMVKRCDVLAYFGERDEREIISMKVSISTVTPLDAIPTNSRESVAGGALAMTAAG
jgi:hypothetical protein